MDEHVTRKSFWRRNGLKLPGSVRIVPTHSQQTGTDNEVPVVIGARYSYTSLVTSQYTGSNTSSPPPLLPSHYPTSGKTSSSTAAAKSTTVSHNTAATTRNNTTNKSSSTSTNKKEHKRHVSSTQHKSFNIFLEDTNDEWGDSIDNNTKKAGSVIPARNQLSPSPSLHPSALSPATAIAVTTTSTAGKSASHNNNYNNNNNASTTTTQPSSSFSLSSSTSQYTSALAISTENRITTPATTGGKISSFHKKSTDANGVILNVKDVLEDPTHILQHVEPEKALDPTKTKKMMEILSSINVDLVALRSICWSGIPPDFRLVAWQLLLGYLPCNSERRTETLARKRKEYLDSVKASYARGTAGLDQSLWHQIHIDILRTNPGVFLYQSSITQESLERILYQWAIRHPASGYVQGINDLVTPIFEVFLSAYIDSDPEEYDIKKLHQDVLDVVEADSFWCLSKLLDGIQDNYTFAQPGIQRQIVTLKDLVSRIDGKLASHLQREGIEFIQFAFRWMNCLLMRELPLKSTIRMWDTYLAEGSSEGFSEFHVYVCAAFLVKWSAQLQKMDFQEVMIFLQQLPTSAWQEKDIELLLSEAYMWKTLFHNAPSHLKNK